MGEHIMIELAKFSKYPSGRDAGDGDFNGTRFRDEILVPAVKAAQAQNKKLSVSLSGVMSFGSSFLEEAFGGLVAHGNATKEFLKNNLVIEPGKPSYKRYEIAIWNYINKAG